MESSANQTESAANPSPDVLETLVEALAHSDASVRAGAAREFIKRKDKRGINPLVEVLSDPDAAVRMEAAVALNELGWRPNTDTQQALHAVACQQFEVAVQIGKAAIDPLVRLLGDGDTALRMASLEALAQIGSTAVINPLIDVLQDENPHVRAVAVQALSKIGDPGAVAPLSAMAHDPSWEVRSVVLDALEALNSIGCFDALTEFLKDELPDLRLRAVGLLGAVGDVRAITALVVALTDPDAAVRAAAETNLKILDANWPETEYAKSATSGLLPALKHNDDVIREKAADTLRLIGQLRAMNSYLAAEMGTKSNAAVPILANSLKTKNRDLRQAAAEALGRIGDANAIEPLVEALCDEDQWVREAALYALNLLDWKPANDTEVVLKNVILQRWDSAVVFDSLAVEPLVMMLNCNDPEVCKAAIGALAQITDPRVIEPLATMLHHPQKIIRAAAAQALRAKDWMPRDAKEGVLQAIELEDWATVAQHGASAVEPVITTIKENYENRELCEAAAAALSNITDGQAAKALLSYSRDGQLAEAIVAALTNLVEQNPADIEEPDLRAISSLSNIFQFRYTFDARYGSFVRSGLQEVDSSKLKKMALQELARRGL